jgi:hypothetical protein
VGISEKTINTYEISSSKLNMPWVIDDAGMAGAHWISPKVSLFFDNVAMG